MRRIHTFLTALLLAPLVSLRAAKLIIPAVPASCPSRKHDLISVCVILETWT